jgi:hypothetical protein
VSVTRAEVIDRENSYVIHHFIVIANSGFIHLSIRNSSGTQNFAPMAALAIRPAVGQA